VLIENQAIIYENGRFDKVRMLQSDKSMVIVYNLLCNLFELPLILLSIAPYYPASQAEGQVCPI